MKARRDSLQDKISSLEKDLELANAEKKRDEEIRSNLLEENARVSSHCWTLRLVDKFRSTVHK